MTEEQILKVVDDVFGHGHYEVSNPDWIRFARALLAASAPNPSGKQEAVAAAKDRARRFVTDFSRDVGFAMSDAQQEVMLNLFLRHTAPLANPSDKQEAVAFDVWAMKEYGKQAVRASFSYDAMRTAYAAGAAPLAQSAEQDRIDAELFQRLLHARSELGRTIADPMWADHSEVTKAALKRWHGTIDEVIKGASK